MRTALIAGNGLLPVELAKKLSSENKSGLLILAIREDPEILKPYAEKLIAFKTPLLSRALREVKNWKAEQLIMAGGIVKSSLYLLPFSLIFDKLSRRVLKESLRDDHSLLGSVVKIFEEEGVKVIPYWQILPEFIASKGQLNSRSPNQDEMQDINYGCEILKITLPCSFGQSIVIAGRAVVAIEAMEGTDKMIKRAGEIVKRGVLVKMMRADQDLRYDLPTVGTRTLENMHNAGLTCLAVESGRTLILEPEKFFNLSEKYKIAIWGI